MIGTGMRMKDKSTGSSNWFRAAVGTTFVAACIFQFGCATEEDVLFGDPARVAGGTSSSAASSSSSGAGPICTVDPNCGVSWSKDIFEGILDAPTEAAEPTGACGAAGCHEMGAAGLFMPPGQSDTAYTQLTNYKIAGSGPYIVDCEPGQSRIMCNLAFADGVDNDFVSEELTLSGPCGSPMPKLQGKSPGEPLSQEQLDTIAEWIRCGAPNN